MHIRSRTNTQTHAGIHWGCGFGQQNVCRVWGGVERGRETDRSVEGSSTERRPLGCLLSLKLFPVDKLWGLLLVPHKTLWTGFKRKSYMSVGMGNMTNKLG